MKKYQYLVVDIGEATNQEYDDSVNTDFLDRRQNILNKLGENGWELISIESDIFYFKRIISEKE